MGRRSFGENSFLSPIRLIKDIIVVEIQKAVDISRITHEKTKAARIPIPPPLGTTPLWELRLFALSRRPKELPHLQINHDPAPDEIRHIKYKK